VKGNFKTVKKGCSASDGTTQRVATGDHLKPVTYRWELRQVNGRNLLYTFAEEDVSRVNPVFVYSYSN
jgi:hypothetical protein